MAGLRGRTFGGYELVEQLPGGGIADVYRGRPTKAGGRDVVVKVIYPEFAHQPGFLPHFRQIVANSGKLASHPHVLPLLASGEDSGYLYLVIPYVAGGTLRDWMRKGGRMGAGDAAPFFRQLCDALTYAHSLGVVHGNLKPSNILLFEGRHVLVGDFGLLWDVSHMDMNHAGSGTETVEFLAPEVLSGQVTQLSDIYSVGALLFAALSGHAPFQAATPAAIFEAAARQPVPHLAQVNPALGALAQALDAVIQKAMAKRPEDRFPSAAVVAQLIATSIQQAPAPATAFPAGAGIPFVPVGQPSPFGSMPLPPSGSPGAFSAASALPQSGAFAVGAVPFAAPGAPAISLAQAAGAIGGVAVPSLAQLNPPFPPLPFAAKPEPQMEQTHLGGANGTEMQTAERPPAVGPSSGQPFSESTIHVPAPTTGDAPLQPTMHVPAPVLPDVPQQPTMRVPAPGQFAPGQSAILNASQQPGMVAAAPPGLSGFDALPAQPAPRISGAPRAKLGRGAAMPFPTLDDGDEEEFAPPAMPAIRPAAGPNGFAVAGGAGAFDPGARGMSPIQNGSLGQGVPPGNSTLDAMPWDSASLDHTGYDGGFGESGPRESAMYHSSDVPGSASAEFSQFAESTGQPWGMEARESKSPLRGGWDRGYAGEQGEYTEQFGGSQKDTRWSGQSDEYSKQQNDEFTSGYTGTQYTGEYTGAQVAPHYSGEADSQYLASVGPDGRPFSATQLGLPRLTSPVLKDQPPSWHEILSDGGGVSDGGAGHLSGGRSASAERAPTWEDAGESMWQVAVQAPPRPESRLPQHIEAEWMGNGVVDTWNAPPAEPASKRKKKNKRGRQEEPEDSGFDDDRVWTVGTTAVRPRRRWPRRLALLFLLILLIDLAALVMLRPDLCPTQGCRTLSATLRHQFGLSQGAPKPASLNATPGSVTLNVASGKSASASFTIENATGSAITWKASPGLSWITLDPASGSLATNGAATLTLTAKPINVKAGTYTTNITITLATATPQTVSIPVTITVTA